MERQGRNNIARLYNKQQSSTEKNSALYKTHKEGNPIRLLTTSCDTAIENLSKFIEKNCVPLTNLDVRINDTKYLQFLFHLILSVCSQTLTA